MTQQTDKNPLAFLIALIAIPLLAGFASSFAASPDMRPTDYSLASIEKSISMMSFTAALFTAIWIKFAFPKMGRSYIEDILLTLITFPFVGFCTGLVGSIGFIFVVPSDWAIWYIPGGIALGLMAAIDFPLKYPELVGPIYAASIALMMVLPRLSKRHTSSRNDK